jgi:hypothetical protein
MYQLERKQDGSVAHVHVVLLFLIYIALRANKDLESIGALLHDLWEPFVKGVVERTGIDQGKADKEDICVGE